jgi:hypothetical protein
MLMHFQACVTCSAAAASDAVEILKNLAPLHAAALALHPSAEAAAKCIVMRTEPDALLPGTQVPPTLVMQVVDHLFAAARLFADSVGEHVNSICMRLLQSGSGLDGSLRSVVVSIMAAVYRINCNLPHLLRCSPTTCT